MKLVRHTINVGSPDDWEDANDLDASTFRLGISYQGVAPELASPPTKIRRERAAKPVDMSKLARGRFAYPPPEPELVKQTVEGKREQENLEKQRTIVHEFIAVASRLPFVAEISVTFGTVGVTTVEVRAQPTVKFVINNARRAWATYHVSTPEQLFEALRDTTIQPNP